MSQAIFIQGGEAVDYTPGSDVAAGAVVVQSGLVGITKEPISANTLGALAVVGVFDVAKETGAVNVGAAVYWNATGNPVGGVAGSGCATTTVGANTFMGFAIAAALAGDATVRLLMLKPTTVTNTVHNALTAVIADPGAAGAIPVTDSGTCQIVTAAAETRTLAAPTNAGQLLLLTMKTDGGDAVITCATGLNQAGNNTVTLNDAGDAVLLAAKVNGANIRWSVVSNDGATLSTV